MLARIDAEDQADALTLLRWIAFSYEPLTLEQLAEARVIDPTDDPNSDGIVDIDNKGDYQDTLDILTGLVVAVAAYDQSDSKYSAGKSSPDRSASPSGTSFEASGSRCRGDDIVEVIYELSIGSDEGVADFSDMSVDSDSQRSQSAQLIHEHTTVRLAHFSVKEYLQSPRIRNNTARAYHLDPGREHRLLTHSCLTYLTYYSESSLKRSPLGRFRAFPLLRYASKNWWKHTQEQTSGNVAREVRFLLNSKHMDDFLGVHPVEEWTQSYFMDPWENTSDTNSALLFAIYHHLEEIVKTLIVAGVQIDATHDHAGRALHAAVDTGNEAIVQMLLDAKADVNLESPTYHPFAIQVAAVKGHEAIVRLLLEANADPNVQGGEYSTALQAAACHGHDGAVGLLLDGGADVDLLKRHGYHALYVVASKGYEATMRLLIGAGADVNYHCGSWGTAICAAAQRGNATMVKLLLDAKADVNLRGEGTGSALQEAAEKGHESIVRLLLDAGADVTLQKGCIDPPNTALESAVMEGREAIVRLLLTANPVPKASTSPDSVSGGEFEAILQRPGIDAATDANQALFIACMEGKEKLVPILLQAGANANARWRGDGRFVLSGAIFGDHDMVVQNLLNVANVEVDAQDQDRQTALHHASRVSNQQIVEMLLHAKADPMLSEKYGYTALMIAMGSGRKAIAQTMLNAVPDAPHELVLAGALICASELGEGNVVRKLLNDAWKASEATSSRQYWNVELFGPFERCLAFAYLAAARLWNTDIMQTLENAGAALNDQHQHGWIAPFLLWKQGTTWQQERKDSWETCERDIAAIVESRRTKLWDFVPENDEESTDAVQFSSCSF
jgi:ankyrin repeat protein